MNRIEIITPPVASSVIDHDLVDLTERIAKIDHALVAHGALGGEFGYGADWDNDVFTMRPFYWGDCTCGWLELMETPAAHKASTHDADCYQEELHARQKAAGVHWEQCDDSLLYEERTRRQDAIYEELTTKYGLSMYGCAVHCTCTESARWAAWIEANKLGAEGHADDCPVMLPNFLYKPSGLRIEWYKWIGRSMEFAPQPPTLEAWETIINECRRSLTPSPV